MLTITSLLRRRLFLGLASGAVMLFAGTGLKAHADSLLERGKNEGITMAFIIEKPGTYLDEAGNPKGYINEIAVDVLHSMGVSVKPLVVEWATLVPGVKSHRYDMAQAMYVLPKRCTEVSFSNPININTVALLTAKGNPKNIKSWDDIKNNPDLRIVALTGSAELDFIKKAGVSNSSILPLPDVASIAQAIVNGQADALSLSIGTVSEIVKASNGQAERVMDFVPPDYAIAYEAFPFAKDNTDFLDEFNKHLTDYMNSPAYLEKRKQYGLSDEAIPQNKTIAEICARTE